MNKRLSNKKSCSKTTLVLPAGFVFGVPKHAQSAGFEPARAEPNGFLVHRLNHSATTASYRKWSAEILAAEGATYAFTVLPYITLR